jgi:hypothetical protein
MVFGAHLCSFLVYIRRVKGVEVFLAGDSRRCKASDGYDNDNFSFIASDP